MKKEKVLYGWTGCNVKEMRHQFHNAVMQDGEKLILTVGIIMLVWCVVSQKVKFSDTYFIS